jgi:PAS domain S-box-containing protein
MIGRPLLDAYPELIERRMDRFYRQALAGEVAVLSQRFHRYLLPLPSGKAAPMQQSAQVAPLVEGGGVVGTITMIQDVTERVEYERELKQRITEQETLNAALGESEARYRVLTEESPVGVFLIQDGLFRYVNQALAGIVGRAQSEMVGGVSPLELIAPESRFKIADEMGRLIRTPGDHLHLEFRSLRSDGSLLYLEGVAASVMVDRRPAILASVLDITEQKLAQEEREALIRELDAFAHTVAHDLKNPISLILGYTDLLTTAEGAIPEEERQIALNAVLHSAQKMRNIVDELLLLARVRKGEVDLAPMNMARIVSEARQRLAYMIEEYQATVVVTPTWPMAMGYGPWIEEVWVNYLSNALKYGGTPPRVELGADLQDGAIVRFWVRDNGPGLSPEEQARLFTEFTRLDQARAKGHGLGLSIVHRIVDRLGGQVGVESAGVPGHGSLFYFTLPLA